MTLVPFSLNCGELQHGRRAEPHVAAVQIRKQNAGGQVKRAVAFRAAGQPAEPPLLARRDGSLASVEKKSRVVTKINFRGEAELAEVVLARGALRLGLAPRQGGQKHRRENCDDGDDDEQFNQRETISDF